MSETGETHKAKRRIKFWHIAVLLLCVLVLAFGAFRLITAIRLQNRIDAVRAAGYPVTPAELDAWYAIPPFAENAADYITTAFTYFQIPEDDEREGLPFLDNATVLPRTEPMDEATAARIDQLIRDNQETLKLLRQGASIENSRYPVDFTRGTGTLLPHLSEVRKAAFLLALEATLHAETNEPEPATQAILASCGLARSLAGEPVLISQMLRQAVYGIGIQALEHVLNRIELDESQLIQLDRTLAEGEDPNTMVRALAAEQCFGIQMMRDPQAFGASSSPEHKGLSMALFEVFRAAGLLDLILIQHLDHVTRYIEVLQLEPRLRPPALAALKSRKKSIAPTLPVAQWLLPALDRIIELNLMHTTRLRIARVAVALERFRRAHARCPEQLTDLVPTFLDRIPTDPFDGQDLRYQTRDPGFVVYSIGTDGVDDGGKERPRRQRGQEETQYDITFIVER